MTKLLVSASALVAIVAVPTLASAQSAPPSTQQGNGCPPGSWFCAEPPQQQPLPAQKLQQLPADEEEEETPAPPARHAAPPPPTVTYQPAPQPQQPPPPVVVYQPPPPVMVVRPETPPPYVYTEPRREPISRAREWGLNLRLEGAMLGSGKNTDGTRSDPSMAGVGAGLRYKPTRSFGLEADLDFIGGRDYQGYKRDETAFTINALIFLNPKSRAQLYLLAGFGWSGAHVQDQYGTTTMNSATYSSPVNANYHYFGGQVGGGLEIRLSRSFAFNIDLIGFMRSRTDDGANYSPEFIDPATGRSTNSSGGALLRGGMTLYF